LFLKRVYDGYLLKSKIANKIVIKNCEQNCTLALNPIAHSPYYIAINISYYTDILEVENARKKLAGLKSN